MDDAGFEPRPAIRAVMMFADEWVYAVSSVLGQLLDNARQRTNERRVFLTSVTRLQLEHVNQIRYLQVMKALGDRISRVEDALHEPLCELFTYFMELHPDPAAYRGFTFRAWVQRKSAG
jgi:hypothetical protein